MPTVTREEFEKITKELYIKNLDLVNVNRELALLQKLYEIIANSFKPADVGSKFIKIITEGLDFHTGIVALIDDERQCLKVIATTTANANKKTLDQLEGNAGFKFSLRHRENLLVEVAKSKTRRKRITHDLGEIFTPLVNQHEANKLASSLHIKSTIVFPLIFGSRTLGVFAIASDKDLADLPEFEKTMLKRVAIVFGLAIERVLLYQNLSKANRELRHLDKLKDEFVYIATHELKNPVTAMRGYLSLINEGLYGDVPKKLKDPLTQLNASNQQLVTLVNDLLQIARSEAKSITIHTETVDVCAIIQAVLGSLKPLADQKKIKLAHHCLTKQLLVKADPDKLREIFNNLVSNAIKYSETGTISIYHIIEQDMVVTHVKDQGFGIAEEDQKKLFTRFYRVEEQVAKGIPGTGLGLFIVKQLIEKMGGRIWFTSKQGAGTTFSFSLPQG